MKQESNTTEQENDSRPVGRPLKFETVEALDKAIQDYFDICDPHVVHYQADAGRKENGETIWETRTRYSDQKPYTMHGLARALGVDRKTLLNYKKRDEFFPSVQGALDRCAEFAESQLFGNAANGAKFALTNNYEWEDKRKLEHSEPPQPLLGGATELPDDEEDGDAEAA